MSEFEAMLLSDHLAEALAALTRARDACHSRESRNLAHPEAVIMEITQAELSIARVIGLVAGAPQ